MPGWTGWPLVEGNNAQKYSILIQPWKAIGERWDIVNCKKNSFPTEPSNWANGTIVSATLQMDGTVLIECEDENEDPFVWVNTTPDPDEKRWVNWPNPGGDPPDYHLPATYKIVCDSDAADVNDAVWFVISDNGDSTVTCTFDGSQTLNRTLASLAGKKFRIMGFHLNAGNEDIYASQAQRWPPRPNDPELFWSEMGRVRAVTILTSFSLTVNGQTTPILSAASTATDIQIALEALSTVGSGKVKVEGNGPFNAIFSVTLGAIVMTGAGATVTTPTTVIGDIDQPWRFPAWTTNSHQDRHVITRIDGVWKRIQISSNTKYSLIIPAQSAVPSGEFWIVEGVSVDKPNGGFWRPDYRLRLFEEIDRNGRKIFTRDPTYAPWNPFKWYYGVSEGKYSHHPRDGNPLMNGGGLSQAQFAAETFPVELEVPGVPGACAEANEEVFDNDYRIDQADLCNAHPDSFLSPKFWWSWRALQKAVEECSSFWIKKQTYAGKTHVLNYDLATWFNDFMPSTCRTGTITAVDGSGNASVTWGSALPRAPMSVHWVRIAGDDRTVNGAMPTGTASTGSFSATNYSFVAGDIGKSVLISWGWRDRELKDFFTTLYNTRWFRPDLAGSPAVPIYEPPRESEPGEWIEDGPATRLAEYDKFGVLKEDTGPLFVNGMVAQFAGRNFNDPSVQLYNNNEQLARFEDMSWRGVPGFQTNWFNPPRSGVVTSATSDSFTDANAQWEQGALVVHTGVGTTGSNTVRMHDSNLHKLWPNNDDPPTSTVRLSQFWSGTNSTRMVGLKFRLEVSPGVWEEARISSQNIGDPTDPFVEYTPGTSVTSAARNYQIIEPKFVRDRWKNITCRLKEPDGTVHDVVVVGNWNQTAFFTAIPGLTIQPGWSYEFLELNAGLVLHRSAGQWKLGTFHDISVAQDTRGQNWHSSLKYPYENLATKHTVYDPHGTGNRFTVGDIIAFLMLNDVMTAINLLAWGTGPIIWSSQAVVGVAEDNEKGASDSYIPPFGDPGADFCAEAKTKVEDAWDLASAFEADGVAPFTESVIALNLTPDVSLPGAQHRYAYAVIATCGNLTLNRQIEAWAKGIINVTDPDEGTVEELHTSGACDGNVRTRRRFIFDSSIGIGHRVWGSMASTTTNQGEVRIRIGPADIDVIPSWPPCPSTSGFSGDYFTNCLHVTSVVKGVLVTASAAIIKWDVAGGLEFVG